MSREEYVYGSAAELAAAIARGTLTLELVKKHFGKRSVSAEDLARLFDADRHWITDVLGREGLPRNTDGTFPLAECFMWRYRQKRFGHF